MAKKYHFRKERLHCHSCPLVIVQEGGDISLIYVGARGSQKHNTNLAPGGSFVPGSRVLVNLPFKSGPTADCSWGSFLTGLRKF